LTSILGVTMQLLDNSADPFSHLPCNGDVARLQTTLEHIAHHVQIEPDSFRISHPSYQPLEVPAESVERFSKLPAELRLKYFSLQVRSFLYGIYYNGSLRTTLALESERQAFGPDLENNTFMGMDLAFYQQLHDSNRGAGYFDPGWAVVREESDRSLAVHKSGLTLHVKREEHLKSADVAIAVGDAIEIRLPKNLVQNGFYMAVGNAGHQRSDGALGAASQLVRVYWSLDPAGAIAVMATLTEQLNQISLPFSFKVLHNPADYNRFDSGVLYFEKSDYDTVRPIVQAIYQQHQTHFASETPLFTKTLAPGLGLAEEPNQQFAAQESFGMNRCQIVANGLLAAQQQSNQSAEARIAAIHQQFSLLGIDVERPYLNAGSEDIY
jgi:hypothetical protein